jgi:integrase
VPHAIGRRLDEAADAWLAYRAANPELTNSTHNRRGAILRRVCNLARRWGWTTEDLGARIQLLPENSPRHIYLTPTEVAALASKCGHRPTRDAILIAAYAGLRLSEILRLTPTDVRRGCLHLSQTKSGRPRVVPIHPAIRTAVARLPINCGPRWITRHFERARIALERQDWHFHDLRHTNASWLVQSGADLVTVRDLLGHSSLAVTSRYAHLATKHLRAAVMKIGKRER